TQLFHRTHRAHSLAAALVAIGLLVTGGCATTQAGSEAMAAQTVPATADMTAEAVTASLDDATVPALDRGASVPTEIVPAGVDAAPDDVTADAGTRTDAERDF